MSRKLTTKEFITKAKQVHEDKYDYSKSVYTKSTIKLIIVCKVHGDFPQLPTDHTRGCGCPKCGKRFHHTTNDFIEKARLIHGDNFDYSKTDYVKNNIKTIMTCKIHGDLSQTPETHLVTGCSKCNKEFKRQQRLINKLIR